MAHAVSACTLLLLCSLYRHLPKFRLDGLWLNLSRWCHDQDMLSEISSGTLNSKLQTLRSPFWCENAVWKIAVVQSKVLHYRVGKFIGKKTLSVPSHDEPTKQILIKFLSPWITDENPHTPAFMLEQKLHPYFRDFLHSILNVFSPFA